MNESGPVDAAVEPPCSCKLGRNLAAYGLEDLHATIRERRADGDSLRDLERFVNRSLLDGAIREAGADVIGDVDGIYDALTGDDVSAGKRTEVRERLEHAGVDVGAVEAAFVSYQTVRSHLRECLDVETARESRLSVDDARGTIEWARSRSEGIVERTVQRLAAAEEVAAGDVDVSHVVRIDCSDCGASYPVDRFVDRGGCDCGD
ncbi:hypothetical protein SAMN05216559_3568 [Halomicrobium zhouii]|uniref:Uncharacterized protein n=1 Tax=Halomicrobium zhouii TaxID=767519 RepID=A0A1I6M254_9EURY|nr:rod-determining factor RdfA [Halomicrobium zhouii]SFS09714.1 hypothetical protein SAMN05216559_3568 [Halomicrobium zhouii]